jgi:hypothetical protein
MAVPRWPKSHRNLPSLVNFWMLSPRAAPESQTFPALSTTIACSDWGPGRSTPGAGQPGTYPGAPQPLRRLPCVSNSRIAGAAMQQSLRGGVLPAPDSSGVMSRGRLITHQPTRRVHQVRARLYQCSSRANHQQIGLRLFTAMSHRRQQLRVDAGQPGQGPGI